MNKSRLQEFKKPQKSSYQERKSVDHLLNFQYGEYQQQAEKLRRERNTIFNSNNFRERSRHHKSSRRSDGHHGQMASCSKHQIILARNSFGFNPSSIDEVNQFLLRNDIRLASNAKIFLEKFWKDVSTIIKYDDSKATCAICLDPFISPRMAKCGHVFCLLCMQRLVHHQLLEILAKQQLDDVTGPSYGAHKYKYTTPSACDWSTCPLCLEYITLRDSKRVEFLEWLPNMNATTNANMKSPVTVKLFRSYGNEFCLQPINEVDQMPTSKFPLFEKTIFAKNSSHTGLFSKFYVDSFSHQLDRNEQDRQLMSYQLQEAENFLDSTGKFLCKQLLNSLEKDQLRIMQIELDSPTWNVNETHASNQNSPKRLVYLGWSVDGTDCGPFVLHPFNMKCLLKEQELNLEFAKFPAEIQDLRVVDTEQHCSVDEAFLKSNIALQHLLPGSRVVFLECDIGNILSDETKLACSEEFNRRKELKQTKRRYEKRADRLFKNQEKSIRDEFNEQVQRLIQDGALDEQTLRSNTGNELSSKELRDFLRPMDSSQSQASDHDESSQSDVNNVNGNVFGSSAESRSAAAGWSSFAKIVDKNGYFPELSATSTALSKDKLSSPDMKPGWVTLGKSTMLTNISKPTPVADPEEKKAPDLKLSFGEIQIKSRQQKRNRRNNGTERLES